jgi:hypothetical protein
MGLIGWRVMSGESWVSAFAVTQNSPLTTL